MADRDYVVRIVAAGTGSAGGKLCDAEIEWFAGPFEGLRLIGFALWEARGNGRRNVTMPARTYSVNGERRSYALLRPGHGAPGVVPSADAMDRVRDMVIDAWDAWQAAGAGDVDGTLDAAEQRASRPELYR